MTLHPAWMGDARTPLADECSLARLLALRSQRAPGDPFARFSDGSSWTNAEAYAIGRETGAAMVARGVRAGDRVVNWLPNGAAHMRVMFGAALIGATPVPMNPALRGAPLAGALEVAAPSLIVTHASLAERLTEIDRARSAGIVALETSGGASAADVLRAPAEGLVETPASNPWDLAAVLYTSGTTGGVKAVRVTNAQLWSVAKVHFGFLKPSDRVLLTTPLCHIGPLSALVGAIIANASVAVTESFRTASFWADVRHFGATAVPGLGPSLLHFLNKLPPCSDDREHGLRLVNVVAADDAARSFSRRYGVSVFPSFGMTEISVPLVGDVDTAPSGSCGRVRAGMEVRIVDANDIEVPIGEIGEMIVRAQHPWTLNDGYEANPAATVAAWRNGWFHTGDAAWRDAEGNFFFADRIKDIIRRRGENIASIDVEREAKAFPSVGDAAAVAVESGPGDQEVLLVVSPLAGHEVKPRELIEFMLLRLPHFMVPRYVRVISEMPRTPSNKIRKSDLRQEGLPSDAWDREQAGIVVRGERFGSVA